MRIILAIFISLLTTNTSFAQQPQKKVLPKLITMLGNYKDSVKLTADEAERILALPLRIVDDKRTVYTVASYQFLYRRNVYTEDEQTGNIVPATSLAAQRFVDTQRPEYWLEPMRRELKPGEVVQFFDIIVKDPYGKVAFAPDFKVTII